MTTVQLYSLVYLGCSGERSSSSLSNPGSQNRLSWPAPENWHIYSTLSKRHLSPKEVLCWGQRWVQKILGSWWTDLSKVWMEFRMVGSMPRWQEGFVLECHSKNSQSQILLLLHAELPHKFLILNSNRWQWEGVRNMWSMHCFHCSRSSSNQHLGEYLGWGLHLTFVLDRHNQLYLPASLFLLPLQYFFTTSMIQLCTFLPFSCVKFSANNALYSDYTLL